MTDRRILSREEIAPFRQHVTDDILLPSQGYALLDSHEALRERLEKAEELLAEYQWPGRPQDYD